MKKRNAIVLILGIVFGLLGVGGLVLGYWLSGCDIVAWFHSKWAIFIGVAIMLDTVIVAGWLIRDWIREL